MAQGFVNNLAIPLALSFGGTGAALTLPLINKIVVKTFTANTTYSPTLGMKYCIVEVLSGGGGGSGISSIVSQTAIGGAGGGGAYSKGLYTAATVGASQAITVGIAGFGGAAGGSSGGTGGVSSFGSLIICAGGIGGSGQGISAVVTARSSGNGAGGAVTTAGNIVAVPGQRASFAMYAPSGAGGGCSATGAHSIYGAGGPAILNSTGINATGYGAGGSAGASTGSGGSSSFGGGPGSPGIVIITEFIST